MTESELIKDDLLRTLSLQLDEIIRLSAENGVKDKEIAILREGLCDIAKNANEHKNPTYGDMALRK